MSKKKTGSARLATPYSSSRSMSITSCSSFSSTGSSALGSTSDAARRSRSSRASRSSSPFIFVSDSAYSAWSGASAFASSKWRRASAYSAPLTASDLVSPRANDDITSVPSRCRTCASMSTGHAAGNVLSCTPSSWRSLIAFRMADRALVSWSFVMGPFLPAIAAKPALACDVGSDGASSSAFAACRRAALPWPDSCASRSARPWWSTTSRGCWWAA
mmetsp:Transcript_19911/g.49105  ORF Transcript_19911/g.49105 Transcript_19911/m.49105 type:complete len:217 (+) Transcript_19911:104-754(+)